MAVTVPLHAGNRVVVLGDSITAAHNWYLPLSDQFIAPQFGAQMQTPNTAIMTPAGLGVKPTYSPAETQPTWVNSGHSGDTVGDVIPLLATRVYAYEPFDVLVIQLGINDTLRFKNNTDMTLFPSVTQTNTDTLLSTLRARYPTMPIVWIGSFAAAENWPEGANAWDSDVEDRMARVASVCATYSVVFGDMRTPFFAWETANNPTQLGSGLLTIDAVHPTNPLGVTEFSLFALPYFTVVR